MSRAMNFPVKHHFNPAFSLQNTAHQRPGGSRLHPSTSGATVGRAAIRLAERLGIIAIEVKTR
jgi:hypothetical protein